MPGRTHSNANRESGNATPSAQGESMAVEIKFGTSGWRAIVAEEFTLANIRRAVTGIAKYVASQPGAHSVLVGRDPRFLGETFVAEAARVLAAHGLQPIVITNPAPTPAIAYAVRERKTGGAINFTASHNPPEYNGIKFSTPDGAPALPEVTKQIEAAIAALGETPVPAAPEPKEKSEELDVKPAYLKRLAELVDFPAIKKSGIKVVFDPFWGAARGYSCHILREHGVETATVHDYRDVLFGGHAPEPDDHLLGDCKAKMKETGAKIGIATDGDADRFGIVDADGTFIQPNYIIALLFDYLVETRGWRNGVAKSVATTNLVNALADHYKIQLYETPVGFKYIGELINQDKIAIGGEESAGLTIRGHVPEKDGVIAGLLVAEMVAVRGLTLGQQLLQLFAKVGEFHPNRENFRLTPEVKEKFVEKVKTDPEKIGSRKVTGIVRTDGLKLILDDGSWVCYRLSGTEPVVRVYSEARRQSDSEGLSKAANDWVLE
jgi:phosphoglucomutase